MTARSIISWSGACNNITTSFSADEVCTVFVIHRCSDFYETLRTLSPCWLKTWWSPVEILDIRSTMGQCILRCSTQYSTDLQVAVMGQEIHQSTSINSCEHIQCRLQTFLKKISSASVLWRRKSLLSLQEKSAGNFHSWNWTAVGKTETTSTILGAFIHPTVCQLLFPGSRMTLQSQLFG